jgi:2-oxoisovalerate dehydrogenase E1 component
MVQRCVKPPRICGRVVVDLRTIIPWDAETVLECVRKTGKILVVHEDTWTAGFAGEIAATVASQAFTFLDAPIERMAVPDIPIPYNIRSMESVIPSVEEIRTRMQLLLYY